jgi:2-dehydro-3-deoxyphosphooctonate aldolase (KDO 8-P synthase)
MKFTKYKERPEMAVHIGKIAFANDGPLVVIGGVNVLENYDISAQTCAAFKAACENLGLAYVFKGSFDKANRSSHNSYRGPGLEEGLEILARIKQEFAVPVVTDVHEIGQVSLVAEAVDILQLPAFLARQTDLVEALAKTGRPINVKKPQFSSPSQICNIVAKFEAFGCSDVIVSERGSCFGYDNLVVDMLGFGVMKNLSPRTPLVFDATHALQMREPGASASGGRRDQIFDLARAGVAVGLGGIFLEAHPDPDRAKCDGPSAITLDTIEPLLGQLKQIDAVVKSTAISA